MGERHPRWALAGRAALAVAKWVFVILAAFVASLLGLAKKS